MTKEQINQLEELLKKKAVKEAQLKTFRNLQDTAIGLCKRKAEDDDFIAGHKLWDSSECFNCPRIPKLDYVKFAIKNYNSCTVEISHEDFNTIINTAINNLLLEIKTINEILEDNIIWKTEKSTLNS